MRGSHGPRFEVHVRLFGPATESLRPLAPRTLRLVERVLLASVLGAALLLASLSDGGDEGTHRLVPLDERGEMLPPPLPPLDRAGGFAEAVDRVRPAVVSITVHPQDGPRRTELILSPAVQQREELSCGSGVIVSPDGLLLTNQHVVGDAGEVGVTLLDGQELRARVLLTDPRTDIALLRLQLPEKGPPVRLPVAPIARQTQVRVGDFALAIGHPFGLGQTVTLGVVSAVGGRPDAPGAPRALSQLNLIQTDAQLNPGNSGGALINGAGELIGISTALVTAQEEGGAGIGLAVPVQLAMALADRLREAGGPVATAAPGPAGRVRRLLNRGP